MSFKILKNKVLPQNKEISPIDRIINPDTHFSALEAYKIARTNLMFTLAEEKGAKRVIVSSPLAQEGKSTTCINLAITFSQAGHKVLVMDADLRRPKLHTYLSLENKEGLAQFLGGFTKDFHEIVQHVPDKGIDCITGGSVPPNPSELLMGTIMSELLDALSEEYDYIFIDSPPVNLVTDTVTIGRLAAGVLMVVRKDHTRSENLKQALASLEFNNVKVLGYIFNGAQSLREYVYKKKSYKYYY